jgi:hypothetical protein
MAYIEVGMATGTYPSGSTIHTRIHKKNSTYQVTNICSRI